VLFYRIKRFIKEVKTRSKRLKIMATATENKITIIVLFIVSSLLGQFTFFVSRRTSFKNRKSFPNGDIICFSI